MPPAECLPWEPLERLAILAADRTGIERSGVGNRMGSNLLSTAELAELTGMNPRTIYRCRASGEIQWPYADAAAVALGMHPCQVWGEDWWALRPTRSYPRRRLAS